MAYASQPSNAGNFKLTINQYFIKLNYKSLYQVNEASQPTQYKDEKSSPAAAYTCLLSKIFFKFKSLVTCAKIFFTRIFVKEMLDCWAPYKIGTSSRYTGLFTFLKKIFSFKKIWASSGVIVSKLDSGLSVTPGITGAIDPSPFYLLPSYKSCEDLARMAKNAEYHNGSWPSYLKYKLYQEWEIIELKAYKAKSNNILNSSPLEDNILNEKILILYDSFIQMPGLAIFIFIFILVLVSFGFILLLRSVRQQRRARGL